jgi:hypothetical protein
MHTYITGIIRTFLKTKHKSFPQAILSKQEVPDDNVDSFVRVFWSYGDQSFYSNNASSTSDMLVLEVYERMFTPESTIEDFILNIRKEMLFNFKTFKYNGKVGRITNVSIIENNNDEMWKSYSLIIPINVFEEEAN